MAYNPNNNYPDESDKEGFLKELEWAYNICVNNEKSFYEQKILTSITSLFPIILTAIFSFFEKNTLVTQVKKYIESYTLLFYFALFSLIFCFFLILLYSIAKKQRQTSLYKRKIVLLRSILHIEYDKWKVLPTDETIGALHPYKVRMLDSYDSSFFFIILANTIVSFFIFILSSEIKVIDSYFIIGYLSISSLFFFGLYRYTLRDEHESVGLFLIRIIAFVFRLKLDEFIEQKIYLNNLAVEESKRIKLNLEKYYDILVEIEDSSFYKHKGVDIKRTISLMILFIIKALKIDQLFLLLFNVIKCFFSIFSRLPYCIRNKFTFIHNVKERLAKNKMVMLVRCFFNLKGGGSSITQQYVRSNFIYDYNKTYRRKIIELLLARFWIEHFFCKKDIINLYLCSVRFDCNVFGLAAAHKHFYGEIIKNPTKAQIFVLIDRLSNVNSKILSGNIYSKICRLYRKRLLSEFDIESIFDIYRKLIINKKIGSNSTYDIKELESLIKKIRSVVFKKEVVIN